MLPNWNQFYDTIKVKREKKKTVFSFCRYANTSNTKRTAISSLAINNVYFLTNDAAICAMFHSLIL